VDVEFEPVTEFEANVPSKSTCGKTLQVEDPRYQAGPLTVCLIYSEVIISYMDKKYLFY
jgi:hypothetical protein